jgi:hypothetical protein
MTDDPIEMASPSDVRGLAGVLDEKGIRFIVQGPVMLLVPNETHDKLAVLRVVSAWLFQTGSEELLQVKNAGSITEISRRRLPADDEPA